MSASLVGSEMCIRDRCPSPGPASRRTGQHAPGSRLGPGRRGSRARPLLACLLYTSDAADDM
eukprot:7366128-Alexandrium_andersonii.AAC.1